MDCIEGAKFWSKFIEVYRITSSVLKELNFGLKMSLKLYVDLMSQPSRALYILLKYVKYDKFAPILVNLAKGSSYNFLYKNILAALFPRLISLIFAGEHYGDKFTAVNRMQRVPVIDHNGFILTER